jgi:hypothetical protein
MSNIDLYFTVYAGIFTKAILSNGQLYFKYHSQTSMIKCPPGRFGSLANDSKLLGIDNFFWCPNNKDFTL